MPDQAAILDFCVNQLSTMLEVDADTISPSDTFLGIGLDSAMLVHFIISVEDELNLELYPSVADDYPVLEDFCRFVASQRERA
ncbi:acyl carrier protein [Rhizobium sp. FY34]|uniref:acyl carrier protein n=1 Tax=Rhizobium sp. FY34 TaxID=2562309 RepID=UPI0010C03554|nr:acyl carrier protein [Rhizobium sp. FY34]